MSFTRVVSPLRVNLLPVVLACISLAVPFLYLFGLACVLAKRLYDTISTVYTVTTPINYLLSSVYSFYNLLHVCSFDIPDCTWQYILNVHGMCS